MGVNELSSEGADRIRVLVADDHPVVRTGLAAVIAQEPDLLLVAEAENGERAVALYREHRPDVVLMDLRMPLMDGVEAIGTITAEFPVARILALTTYEGDADIRRARGGCAGLPAEGHAPHRRDHGHPYRAWGERLIVRRPLRPDSSSFRSGAS
jgi:CheY-like chemotaxis protein